MPGPRRRAGTATMFAALAVTWGSSFLLMKVGLQGLTPGQVVWARLVLGAAALLALCAITRTPLPRDARLWAHLLVVAVLLCVVPFSLFAWAELHVSSGLASVLNATTPLLTMLVALVALPEERLTAQRSAGLLLGFAGVLVVLEVWRSGGGSPLEQWGQLACLLATTSYGLAFVHLRRHVSGRGVPALTLATGQVGLAALLALLGTPLVAGHPPELTAAVVGSMVLLGVLGTGVAYVWNTTIVARWGATNASTVTYLTPLIGVLLGVLVLGERASWNQPLGAVVVVAGVMVAQGRLRLPTGPGRREPGVSRRARRAGRRPRADPTATPSR